MGPHLRTFGVEDVAIPAIVALELTFGALRSSKPTESARVADFLSDFVVVPFGGPAVTKAAEIRFDLTRRGLMIGPYDLLIAATALAHDLTLVTHNVREFSRVQGLRIEDWQAGQ